MPTPKLTRRMYLYFTPEEAVIAENIRARLGLHSINETVRIALRTLAREAGLAPHAEGEPGSAVGRSEPPGVSPIEPPGISTPAGPSWGSQ